MSLATRWDRFLGQHEHLFDDEDHANAVRDVFYAGAMAFYLEAAEPTMTESTVHALVDELHDSLRQMQEGVENEMRRRMH